MRILETMMKMRLAYESNAAYSSRHPRQPATRDPFDLGVRLRGLLDIIAHRQRRRIERRAMLRLDDHMLRDIGLDRMQVEEMAARPFWRV